MSARMVVWSVCAGLGAWSGCQTDPIVGRGAVRGAPVTAIESVQTARESPMSLAAASEVDLVEQVVHLRSEYKRTLELLRDYYKEHGHREKHVWAQSELDDVMYKVQPYHYLLDSELPRLGLVSRDNIAAANALFERAAKAAKDAGHGMPALYNKEKMIRALELFKQLIRDYPTSNKIDDAAFYCGEIYKEYLQDSDMIAVQWYERAWTWDPAVPYAARFQAATVYDYRLHDRKRALELYRACLAADPPDNKSNRRWAQDRIAQLTVTEPVDSSRTQPVAKPSGSADEPVGQKAPALPRRDDPQGD